MVLMFPNLKKTGNLESKTMNWMLTHHGVSFVSDPFLTAMQNNANTLVKYRHTYAWQNCQSMQRSYLAITIVPWASMILHEPLIF